MVESACTFVSDPVFDSTRYIYEYLCRTPKNKKEGMKVFACWILVLIWCVVIFSFSSIPAIKTPDPKWWEFWFFKLAHVIEYAILYGLVFRTRRNHFISALFVVLYGISDEWHQSFVPGRESNYLRDVGFDSFGGFLAGFTLWKLLPILKKKQKN